ncbi:MAG: TspO/MBR family protein, partial [Micromonosporaceae bacterium]
GMAPVVKITIAVVGGVAATAAVGSAAADPRSAWYRSLRKPSWQPAPPVYALAWTPLYAAIAYAGARALNRAEGRDRRRLARSFFLDLALNASWTPLFFRACRPRIALAEIVCLDIANALLIRRAWQADRQAAALLIPYAAWTVFATALNAEIVRLNPGA